MQVFFNPQKAMEQLESTWQSFPYWTKDKRASLLRIKLDDQILQFTTKQELEAIITEIEGAILKLRQDVAELPEYRWDKIKERLRMIRSIRTVILEVMEDY